MITSTLILPVSGKQDLAGWAAVAFVATNSSTWDPAGVPTQRRLWFSWCEQHHLDPLAEVRRPHVELAGAISRGAIWRRRRSRSSWSCSPGSTATASRNSSSNTPRPCTCADQGSPRDRPGSDSTGPSSARSSSRPGCPAATTTLWPACSPSTRLRVSEACGAAFSDLAVANGHHVVRIVGKGNQPALIPLAPRTARAIDAAVGVNAPTDHCSPPGWQSIGPTRRRTDRAPAHNRRPSTSRSSARARLAAVDRGPSGRGLRFDMLAASGRRAGVRRERRAPRLF
jgi:integrase/recombinase XerD